MIKAKKFKYPPLTEVAFEIKFDPKLRIFDKLSDFQELIASKLPQIGEEHLFPFSSNMPLEDSTRNLKKRVVFEDSANKKLLRLSVDGFNFIEKSYESFAKYQKEIATLWKDFSDIMGNLSLNRIGLRYINHLKIPYTDELKDMEKYIKPYYSMERLNKEKVKSISIESRILRDDYILTIRSGIISEDTTDKGKHKVYLLDYDCYLDNPKLIKNVSVLINKYHDVIEKQFLSDLEIKYLKYMERGEFN
ncbi:MAG: hypothetical protein DRP46_01495 [Candidatus Zixiibacteriota bacterium]|nr:MAG: hypothetical protein DRP46_01495 [candidate division Zixibacteria bacterium]